MMATMQHRLRARLRDAFADLNAPLLRRISALELAYQEQRNQLATYRHVTAVKLERVTAQRDELNGLLASAMGERDAAEARAHDLANQVTALQCAGDVDELPIRARWVYADGGDAELTADGRTIADVRLSTCGWRWSVFIDGGEPHAASITGADGERSIAKEQALEEVRVHWGPIEVVE